MLSSIGKRSGVRGIDTNIVVRLLTADDPKQAQAARRVVEGGDIFIPITVMLETEWVLRAGYGFQASHIAAAIRGVAGLPGVSVEQPARLASALEWMEDGMDFAHALHLAGSGHCSVFLTFDRKFAKRASKPGVIPVALP